MARWLTIALETGANSQLEMWSDLQPKLRTTTLLMDESVSLAWTTSPLRGPACQTAFTSKSRKLETASP